MGIDAPEVFAPVLDRLRVDAAKHYGSSTTRLVASRYDERPFSHVLRVEVHNDVGTGPAAGLFVKVFKADADRVEMMRDRVANDYATTVSVYEAMRRHDDLGVVPPIACYPDLLAMVTEEVQGPTLLNHLTNHATWWSAAGAADINEGLERVGRWIRVFQGVNAAAEADAADEMRDYIDHRLKRLVSMRHSGFEESGRTRVLRLVDTLSRAADESDWDQVPVHSDMALGNILIANGRIVVLDFAMAKSGNRLQDVSRVFLQLDLLRAKPFIRSAVIAEGQRALLRGFDVTLLPDRPMFRLMMLRHRINHLVGLIHDKHSFAGQMYNRGLIRRHYNWIRQEVNRTVPAGHVS